MKSTSKQFTLIVDSPTDTEGDQWECRLPYPEGLEPHDGHCKASWAADDAESLMASVANYLEGEVAIVKPDSLPEGLYLDLSADGKLSIRDAEDLAHVEFSLPGRGDPTEWSTTMVMGMCANLLVTHGYVEFEDGFIEDFNIEKILDIWYGHHEVEDGFLP